MAEEREQDKRCWKCNNLEKGFGCNCDLTGDNVVIDIFIIVQWIGYCLFGC